jgi:1-acyl-sn-glycerol-3-phosphate acyltransferase
VIVAETRVESAARRQELRGAVVDRVVATLGVPPDMVLIAPPRTVLKTSSGKIRRSATRDAYLAGTLGRGARSAVRQWARLLFADVGARLRRAALGAVRLAYALWVGTVLCIGMPALWAVLAVTPRGRPADRLVRWSCRVLLALAGCRLRVDGLERLEAIVPAVLAPNHSSYVDSVALLAALPRELPFLFVAKRELLHTPLLAMVLRKVGHLTVERFAHAESVADAAAVSGALRAGFSLVVYPEGTFRRTPGLLPFRLGAFKAAVEAARPVVPVAIQGTREILPADAWLPRLHALCVTIGDAIHPGGAGWPEMVRLRDLTRAAMVELLGRSE